MFLVHLVRLGIVERRIALDTAAETVDPFQIGLHVRFPLAFGPAIAAVLETDSGVYRERGGAIRIRRVQIVLHRVARDAHIVLLVKIVELGAGERLLLYANTHRFLLVRDFFT